MSAQRHFAEAVLAAEPLCPPGLMAWNGSDPARRFAVRNNVMVSLIDALADSYPVTQDLVGEEFFRAMARLFVRTHPPRSPVLALYGAGLAEFIESFAPAAVLPYLADVARRDAARAGLARRRCGAAWPRGLCGPAGECAGTGGNWFRPAPLAGSAAFGPRRGFAVGGAPGARRYARPDGGRSRAARIGLVLRIGLDVEIRRIPCATAQFILHLQQGLAFGAAAQFALDTEPAFDLPAVLGMLICGGAIINLCQPRREPA